MKTIQDIISLSTDYLRLHKIQSPRREAEGIIGYVLGISRLQLYLDHDRPLIESELDRCRSILKRRAKGEPFAYITGEIDFYGAKLWVDKRTLIPRQETEILVDHVASQLQSQKIEDKILWDVCCGSGCIGISLKKRFPQLRVLLSDISEDALNVAKRNAESNDVAVDILLGDLLQPFGQRRADIIICNPPYISAKEYQALDAEVKHFEPSIALLGGEEGTLFYERLSKEAPKYLHSHGSLWMEIGSSQGQKVQSLFQTALWKSAKIFKDWSGHDRFAFCEVNTD